MQWYSASYSDLYTIFQKKNMIDIDELDGYQHTESIGLLLKSPEKFPSEAPLTNSTNSIPETGDSELETDDDVYESSSESESESESEYAEPISKKTLPKVPP